MIFNLILDGVILKFISTAISDETKTEKLSDFIVIVRNKNTRLSIKLNVFVDPKFGRKHNA